MKKALSLFILSSVALAGLSSCNVMEDPQLQTEQKGLHSAFFDGKVTELIDETGTKGLSLVAMPDWRNTATANIHLFENGEEGKNPAMEIDPNDTRIAHFSATFEGGEDERYVYNGIIAPSDESSGAFVVPAEQSPDTEISLIDPNADFLIGCSKESEASSSEKPVDMTFIRPVSLSRLAIVNIGEDEKVKQVTFTADKPLTGKFTKDKVDFDKGTVEFDKTDGSNTVTLKYYDGADPKIIFYAYFVICPVEDANITSIVVNTDKYVYTKKYDEPLPISFNSSTFYSIAVNMSGAERSDARESQELSFATHTITFEMGSAEEFIAPALTGAMTPVKYSSSNADVATVDESTGAVIINGAGETIITATAVETSEYISATDSYTLTVTPATKKFYKVTSPEQIIAGKSYIIISNGYALKNDSGTVAAYPVSFNEDGTVKIVEVDAESVEWTSAAASEDYKSGGDFSFTNGDKMIARESGSDALILASEPSARSFWSLDSDCNDLINKTTGNDPRYMQYIDNTWTAKSKAETNAIAVYTADPSSPEEPESKIYTKATTIEASKSYIIISNGYALKNDSGTVAAYPVSFNEDGTVKIVEVDAESVEWTSAAASEDIKSGGDFSFTNGEVMIARESGSDALIFASAASARSCWSLDSDYNDLINKTTGNDPRYMQYIDNTWTAKSKAETNAIAVYTAQ